MCVAVSKKHDLNICFASSQLVVDYMALLNTKNVGWKDFVLYIRGANLFNMVQESKEETNRNATACSRRNERRKVVTKEILDRISKFQNIFY